MSRRLGAALPPGLAGLAAAVVLTAGCGVRAQDEPEILPTPPPAPTATPSADKQPSGPGITAPPSTPGATASLSTSGPAAISAPPLPPPSSSSAGSG